jgi:hypothetical protein
MKNISQDTDPAFEQLFAQINPEIVKTFNEEQLEAIKMGFGSRGWTRHPLDIRVISANSRIKVLSGIASRFRTSL